MDPNADQCSSQYQLFVGLISFAIGLPAGILLAVALCHRSRLLRCKFSVRSSYVLTGRTSRFLRHVSVASALKTDCPLLVFVHKKQC